MEELVKISESEMQQVIEGVANVVVATLPDVTNNGEVDLNTEVARLNKNETKIFPYNKFCVKVWSNDSESPHFHVECEGWDISCLIENGEVYKVNTEGEKANIEVYIRENAKEWLNSPCALLPKMTNKEATEIAWDVLH